MLRPRDWRLINGEHFEALPAALARARANAAARALARADWLIRRKDDGRYLAAVSQRSDTLRAVPLDPAARRLADALHAFAARLHPARRERTGARTELSLHHLPRLLHALGLPDDYGARHALALVAEPVQLAFAGFDRYRRPLWLHADAARAWARMREAARRDGVVLEAISGYRSHAYQLGIFRRKLARGQTVEQILAVNAAPGYSEHHSGRALDIGTPGEPPAEESFETTTAFAWLGAHAGAFGFVMSYPRDNPHGIVYEPWHWCWRRAGA
ncbi:M15 family metallopeptidase [Rehaibacterium terrae]|jgi:D-alanyl-D-alanine carboxypeptidase|uniref:D-alanyl-D-alanine carboxypeptidase n=1 Tax=Rehaibacterium terrae TaxID=1341696 RepID=A0A7W7V6W3_9GAMM|nr:M15 family metallopeptidase [Rehaibacterium terrae]MBB5014248.1 D-alanyl-D-alanine carboxypeptidase [Rehaibacterium terrae]